MADFSYYSTAAQTIPVVLLALIVQSRIWPSPLDDDVRELRRTFMKFAMASGNSEAT